MRIIQRADAPPFLRSLWNMLEDKKNHNIL
jgi:hypothetical protein